jgi:hypothetical protein
MAAARAQRTLLKVETMTAAAFERGPGRNDHEEAMRR